MAEYIRDRDKGLLFEYKKHLLGNGMKFSQEIFKKPQNIYEDHDIALKLFRFAIEIFLRWTPEMTRTLLDREVIERMKLNTIYDAYIIFPSELDKNVDYWYISHLLYPKKFPYSEREYVIKIYDQVIEDVNAHRRYKFPKNFFNGVKGRDRACICLRRYIERFEVFHDVQEMYAFSASPKCVKVLNQYGLRLVWHTIFSSPVEFMHYMLPEDQRDSFLYHYYIFQYMYKKAQKTTAELNYLEKVLRN